MSTPPALELDHLEVRFGSHAGLAPISLNASVGERLAIVGASGAGKSSLLKTIAGLQRSAGGAVRIKGTDSTRLPPESRGAVYVHQTPVLFPHLDVYDNVAFPLRIRRRPEHEIKARVAHVLRLLAIGDLALRSPASVSGGQRHRIALARAIAARPPILLLDEPLASLDPPLKAEIREAIHTAIDESRATLVFVSHDLAEAGSLAQRIGVLIDRRLAQIDPPDTLFSRPVSLPVARFVGFSNRLDGEVNADGIFQAGEVTVPSPPSTQLRGKAVLLFRPQAVSLHTDGAEARVTEMTHTPISYRIRMALADQSIEAECPRQLGPPPANGSVVRVRIDPRSAVVFPP